MPSDRQTEIQARVERAGAFADGDIEWLLAELSRVQQERDEALKPQNLTKAANYWKAEHLAGNREIERLEAERDALTQEIATLRQQIGDLADGIEALAGPRADDYGRIVTQVAKSLRALLQKGQ